MSTRIVQELMQSAQMALGIAGLMRRPLTVDGAKAMLRARLANRTELFLEMVQRAIWQNTKSPYHHLLVRARWTYERIAVSVHQRGLEATLAELRDAGVYLSHGEFKEHKPIVRDGLRLEWAGLSVENPYVLPQFESQTGGTRSQGSRVPASLAYMTGQRAPSWCLTIESVGGGASPVILWLPRSVGYLWWLSLVHMHRPPLRWFGMTDLSIVRLPWFHRTLYRVTQAIGLAHGLRIPTLEFVPLTEAAVVLDALLDGRARHGSCTVVSSPSGAARLAALAGKRGTDLRGVAFVVGGEPLTPGKRDEITGAGARVGVRYNITELGALGGACGRPIEVDEVHFLADSFAMITNKRVLPDGRPVDALMVTTLLPTSPLILLNLDSDDFADVTSRRCGCLWDELGFETHLSNIRSFSKLTGEGVTVLGTDFVRVLEEVLPGEFGGRSVDYQLLEAEDEDHLTRLYLVVSPAVGAIDEGRLLERFRQEIRHPGGRGDAVPSLWAQAETIRVVRKEPVATPAGKQLPFHTLALGTRRDDDR